MLYGQNILSSESFMADRMGGTITMVHYLAVWQTMVNIHKLIHFKHANLPWQSDHCTPWGMVFKALLNAKAALS